MVLGNVAPRLGLRKVSQSKEGAWMKWLLRPIFHENGDITFYRWKYVDEKDAKVVLVHKTMEEFRAFWQGFGKENND